MHTMYARAWDGPRQQFVYDFVVTSRGTVIQGNKLVSYLKPEYFTGLIAEGDTKVCEGDIIEDEHDHTTWLVYWAGGGFEFRCERVGEDIEPDTEFTELRNIARPKVVGNYHENPEFIRIKKEE